MWTATAVALLVAMQPRLSGHSLPVSGFEETGAACAGGLAYAVRLGDWGAAFGPGRVVLERAGHGAIGSGSVELRLGSDGSRSVPVGLHPNLGRSSYLYGNDRTQWRTQVKSYSRIRYPAVTPGVDVEFYRQGEHLEFDVSLAPGASLERFDFSIAGAVFVQEESGGSVLLGVAGDSLRLEAPCVYQQGAQGAQPIEGRYLRTGCASFSFWIGEHDRSRPVIVDPVLTFSSYLGGSGTDEAYAIAADGAGYLYITGTTWSANFPVLGGLGGSFRGLRNMFVTKLDPWLGEIVFSTYIGGRAPAVGDVGRAIAVDSDGSVFVGGDSDSDDFPLANPVQATLGGDNDAIVLKLDATGSQLLFSTFLGGYSGESARGLAIASNRNIRVAGYTESSDFPAKNAYQPTYGGGLGDFFLAEYSNDGSTENYATPFGGTDYDIGLGLALAPNGDSIIVGYTASLDFPLKSPVQPSFSGIVDAAVVRFDGTASTLRFSSYFGGAGEDYAYDCAADATGFVVAGVTLSSDLPTLAPLQATLGGGSDAIAFRVDEAGNLVFASYLGGSGNDVGYGVAPAVGGGTWIAGSTKSVDFPRAGSIASSLGGTEDAFVAQLSADGQALNESFYFGGGGTDRAQRVATTASGSVLIAGQTASDDLPLQTPVQSSRAGGTDALIAAWETSCALPDSVGGTLRLAPVPGLDARLFWSPALRASDYRVYEDATKDGVFATLVGSSSGAVTFDAPSSAATLRFVRVAATNVCGEGPR